MTLMLTLNSIALEVKIPAECVSLALSRWFCIFFNLCMTTPQFCFDIAAKKIMLHSSGFSPPVPLMSWCCWTQHLTKYLFCAIYDQKLLKALLNCLTWQFLFVCLFCLKHTAWSHIEPLKPINDSTVGPLNNPKFPVLFMLAKNNLPNIQRTMSSTELTKTQEIKLAEWKSRLA